VSGFVQSLFSMAESSRFLLTVLILAIIAYLAFYAGLWFLVTQFLIKPLAGKNQFLILTVWILTAAAYIWCIDCVCLWPFLRIEGYPFIHPLLPLSTHTEFLWPISYVGKSTFTLLLLITNATIAWGFIKKNFFSIMAILLSFLPWIIFFYTAPAKQNPPKWFYQIIPLQIQFPPQPNVFTSLYSECFYTYQQNTNTKLIVLPESALSQPINTSFTNLMQTKLPDLLIGSLFMSKGHTYNTLYWIQPNKNISKFCKRHTLFFTEQLPWWCNISSLDSLLFSESAQRTCSGNPRPLLTISDDIRLVPYLCSELFFNRQPDDSHQKYPIIALCNDWWFSVNYPRQLMLLTAQLKALEWQQPIIYISYFYIYFIPASG
jgi:hypothetical protein